MFCHTARWVYGGCLHPFAEAFLNNKDVMESYLAKDMTITTLNFDKCGSSNCFSLSPASKI